MQLNLQLLVQIIIALVGAYIVAFTASLIIWTFRLGGLGAILAIPMTLLIRALFID